MKKKVMLVSNSTDSMRKLMLNRLREDKVWYMKKESYMIITNHTEYYFFEIRSTRNLERFIKKHKKMDKVYIANSYFTNIALGDFGFKTKLYYLAGHDEKFISEIDTYDYRKLLSEDFSYQNNVIEAFTIFGSARFLNLEIERKVILKSEFIAGTHYTSYEDAKTEVERLINERIQTLESEIKKQRLFLKNF
jgi:hypothetical protein